MNVLSTRCTCWVLERADGLRQGFTDHDAPIVIDGTVCEAVAALDASEARSALGLGAGAQDVAGALDSVSLSEADIAAGRYDGATVEIWRVDWRDPDARTLQRRAILGEIARADGAFTAELRGLAHRLDETQTRRFTRACDAQLGDTRCGVDLEAYTLRADARFDGPSVLLCAQAAAHEDGWFAHGHATFADGTTIEIAAHEGERLTLWRAPPAAADGPVRLVAGCDKTFASCRERFANAENFRGFPHMPGSDFTLGYASTGDLHDGKARVR